MHNFKRLRSWHLEPSPLKVSSLTILHYPNLLDKHQIQNSTYTQKIQTLLYIQHRQIKYEIRQRPCI